MFYRHFKCLNNTKNLYEHLLTKLDIDWMFQYISIEHSVFDFIVYIKYSTHSVQSVSCLDFLLHGYEKATLSD